MPVSVNASAPAWCGSANAGPPATALSPEGEPSDAMWLSASPRRALSWLLVVAYESSLKSPPGAVVSRSGSPKPGMVRRRASTMLGISSSYVIVVRLTGPSTSRNRGHASWRLPIDSPCRSQQTNFQSFHAALRSLSSPGGVLKPHQSRARCATVGEVIRGPDLADDRRSRRAVTACSPTPSQLEDRSRWHSEFAG